MAKSSDKRTRQLANRQAGDALRKGNEARNRRRGIVLAAVTVAICALVIGVVVALTGGGDEDKGDKSATETTDSTESTTVSDESAVELPAPAEGATLMGDTPCPPVDGSGERVQKFGAPPPRCIEDGESYSAVFDTSEGSFTATLDSEAAPVAVNNFVVLSRYHFYDGVPFHRIVPGFVIQGGDGDGEPWGTTDLGYSFEDELPDSSAAYTDYSLAMANSGPDTNASQFFVVLPGGGAQLQPLYTSFGEVIEGREVIDAIGKLGNASQEPTKAVVVNSVKIESSQD